MTLQDIFLGEDDETDSLSSSLDRGHAREGRGGQNGGPEEQSDKFFFTMWTTVDSTMTVTQYTVDKSTTVSVSALCSHSGAPTLC